MQQARQLNIDIARAQHEMDVLTQRYGTHIRATELQVRSHALYHYNIYILNC
jgi:hypothetical protein